MNNQAKKLFSTNIIDNSMLTLSVCDLALFIIFIVFYITFQPVFFKGGVHIMGEICPRSDPDISHMRCMDKGQEVPQFVFTLLMCTHQILFLDFYIIKVPSTIYQYSMYYQ